MEFYKILQSIMEKKELNIPEVARLCDLPDSTIRSMLLRKNKTVALEVAFKLAKGLNVPIETLNGDLPINITANPLNPYIEKYNNLNSDNQQTVNNLIDDLSEKQKIQDEKFEAALQEAKEKAQRQALLIAYGGKNKIHEFTDEELAKLDKWIEEQKSQKLPK